MSWAEGSLLSNGWRSGLAANEARFKVDQQRSGSRISKRGILRSQKSIIAANQSRLRPWRTTSKTAHQGEARPCDFEFSKTEANHCGTLGLTEMLSTHSDFTLIGEMEKMILKTPTQCIAMEGKAACFRDRDPLGQERSPNRGFDLHTRIAPNRVGRGAGSTLSPQW